MLKRFLSAIFTFALLATPLKAAATDYSDMWYNPLESGWGANLVQAEDVIFVTFFVYDQDNLPTWFVAIIYRDASGNFVGNLYTTVGPYFGAPWNPAAYSATHSGFAWFYPSNPYQGRLVYSLTGGPTVEKQIQRQTLKPITLAADYAGGQTGTYAGCMDTSQNGPYTDYYHLNVTQSGNSATFVFEYQSGASCTMSGTLEQHGQLYRIGAASYSCTGTLTFNTTAIMEEIKATAQGIEGRFSAGGVGGSCQESALFSAALF